LYLEGRELRVAVTLNSYLSCYAASFETMFVRYVNLDDLMRRVGIRRKSD